METPTQAGPRPARSEAKTSEVPWTGLVRLDPNDRAQLEAFADLHEITLPDSVPVRFGRRFMTRFYFPKLIADGFAAGDLFRFEDRGFGGGAKLQIPYELRPV